MMPARLLPLLLAVLVLFAACSVQAPVAETRLVRRQQSRLRLTHWWMRQTHRPTRLRLTLRRARRLLKARPSM